MLIVQFGWMLNTDFFSVTVFYHIIVQPRTPLEEEVAAVLRGSAHVLERSNKELTEEEEKALLAMDLEEVHVLEHNEMNHKLSSENDQTRTHCVNTLIFRSSTTPSIVIEI